MKYEPDADRPYHPESPISPELIFPVTAVFEESGFVRRACMTCGSLEARLPAKLAPCRPLHVRRRTAIRSPNAGGDFMFPLEFGRLSEMSGDRRGAN